MPSINADFSLKVVQHTTKMPFIVSPNPQVKRIMLDRVGDEIARATSIVRYEPGSTFERHTHGGGEEILVLEGTFSDEHGHYPAGTYLRNPPQTDHAPFSETGCTLFVKLWQFGAGDEQPVRHNTLTHPWYPGMVSGLSVMPLHEFDGVSTALVRWEPHTIFNPHMHPGGEEILVLDGVFHDDHGSYPAGSWLRSPRYSQHAPYTEAEGATIYVKMGHLGARLLPLPDAS